MSALTNTQKSGLVQLARRAWNFAGAKARGRGEPWPDTWRDFDAWRHAQTIAAAGVSGLRCASQHDYARLRAHFHNLLGEEDHALYWHMQAESEPRRLAELKLAGACETFGLGLNYAEAICRRQFHCNLAEASDRQLWNIFFTITNRGRSRLAGKTPSATSKP